MNGEKKTLSGGESITMPMAMGHTHYSEHDSISEIIKTVSPDLDFEDLLAWLFEIANEGKMKNGERPLLEVMI